MRRTAEEWAKQTDTAWSVCQTHDRAEFWEIGGPVRMSWLIQLLQEAATLCRNPAGMGLKGTVFDTGQVVA